MIRHIVLVDSKRGIAKHGDQPVHIKEDSAYFREKTTAIGGNVLMGRTTFEVIGLLKNRRNFIATHNPEPIPGATVVADVAEFLKSFNEDIWVIGGAAIYEVTLPQAAELYITEIDTDLGCDQFYPEYHDDFTRSSASEPHAEDGLTFRYTVYRRNS